MPMAAVAQTPSRWRRCRVCKACSRPISLWEPDSITTCEVGVAFSLRGNRRGARYVTLSGAEGVIAALFDGTRRTANQTLLAWFRGDLLSADVRFTPNRG